MPHNVKQMPAPPVTQNPDGQVVLKIGNQTFRVNIAATVEKVKRVPAEVVQMPGESTV